MAKNRIHRINEEVQRELASLLRTVKDPRLKDTMLSITHVEDVYKRQRFHSNNTSLRKGSSCEKCICAAAARQAKPR